MDNNNPVKKNNFKKYKKPFYKNRKPIEAKPAEPEMIIEAIEEAQAEVKETELVEIVGIRFKDGGKVYFFSPGEYKLTSKDCVIVETVRGIEYGFVAIENKMVDKSRTVSPIKPIVRIATAEDTVKYNKNKLLEERSKKVFVQKVADHKLEMQLTDVEYTFDNSKLIFYFTADGRVDFRELVKDLASVFHTRIELRQIGVRDEAKLIGGLGVCGQPFCCKRFLNDFAQVSIKMAKEQNLSLSSSKISGNCGRLMCCLSFEQKVYEMEYATFPRVNSVVETESGKGVIVESNFLNGRIKVRMNAEQHPIKAFTASEVKVIGRIKEKEEIPEELKKLEE